MHQPLQNNTLFRGFMWATCLLMLLGCEPWKLPKRECFPATAESITATPSTSDPQIITFTLNGIKGDPASLAWNFDDGSAPQSAPTNAPVTHTYLQAKNYEVKAILTDKCGNQKTIPVSVSVKGYPQPVLVTPTNSPNGGLVTAVDLALTGNAAITRFGICYSKTNSNPTVNDPKQDGVGAPGTKPVDMTIGVPPLEEGETYYIRAYATNAAGLTGYGQTIMFTVLPMTGLVGHYQFNGNATDLAGINNSGTLQSGATLDTDRKGRQGSNVLKLDGQDDYLEIADHAELRQNQITISMWFRPMSLPNRFMHLYYKGRIGNDGGEQYAAKVGPMGTSMTVDAKQGGGCTNGQGWQTAAGANLGLVSGAWYHLVAVADGNQIKLYLNGELKKSENMSGTIDPCTGGGLRFGRQVNEYPNPFHGEMDDIRIYSRALNQKEINALKNE